MNNNYKAFTLVELIVVITILAVLATVAFISFQGYTSSSRDSVRLADLKNISKSFELNRTKGIDFPLPDKKVDISSSGTIFQYQGELSQNILNSDLNIFDGGVDPLTGENYGYAVNSARNKFQVIGFLENSGNIANISLNNAFADNSDKYVKSSGDTLGILLNETTNEVVVDENGILEIDIQSNTDSYSLVMNYQLESLDSVTLANLLHARYNNIASCKAILDNGNSKGNGVYTINPTGVDGEEFEVYCDMKTDGGGWTLTLNKGTSFLDYTPLGDTDCTGYNQNCLNKSWSELPVTDLLIDGSLGDIIGNNYTTRFIVRNIKSGLGNSLHYLMNNTGVDNCNVSGWNIGSVSEVLMSDSTISGGDYDSIIVREKGSLCINDVHLNDMQFFLGANWSNAAGWPTRTSVETVQHWNNNHRIWVR